MRYIPLAFFGSAGAGVTYTEQCYCDEVTLTFAACSSCTGNARFITRTDCNLDPRSSCISTSPSGGTRTIQIAKGTNVTVTAPSGCNSGNAPTVTYNRNYCASVYDFEVWRWTITNCQTGITYVAAFYFFNGFLQAGQIYNFTDINSLSGGNIPNGCYTIGSITSAASDMGINFFNPQNFTSYSSCNECISSNLPEPTPPSPLTIEY